MHRCHKTQHGFDISIIGFPFAACGHWGFFPLVKASYLHYPFYAKNNFSYVGVGIVYYYPFLTIGREFRLDKTIKLFVQMEATYPAAALSLGIGF